MNHLKLPFYFCRDLWIQRFLVFQMTKQEFKNKYMGTSLGFLWTIIQPFIMIFILWLVFTRGFEAKPIQGIPFIAWLTVGLVIWDFFTTALIGSANVFFDYQYLVKKIKFNFSILPLIKIFSSLITHAILLVITIGILISSGIEFSWYWFQTFYYLFAVFILLLGWSWIISTLQVFSKDIVQILNIVLQLGFWGTPILWNYQILPEKWILVMKWNPIFYVTEGYRNSFLFKIPFWHDISWTLQFWGSTFIILLVGIFLFKKLKPHFADVL